MEIIKKKILICGATGYLGKILLAKLAGPYQFVAFYRDKNKIFEQDRIEWVEGDLNSLSTGAKRIIYESTDILYLAGVQGMFNSNCVKENVSGINNLLNNIDDKKKVRLIYFSSIEAFGTTTKQGAKTSDQESPITGYGLSKLMSEKQIEDYQKVNNNFNYVILRLGNVNMESFLRKYASIEWLRYFFGDYELNVLSENKMVRAIEKLIENRKIENVTRYLVEKNLSLNILANKEGMTKLGWIVSDIMVWIMRKIKKGGIWYYLAAGGSKKPYRRYSMLLDKELGL